MNKAPRFVLGSEFARDYAAAWADRREALTHVLSSVSLTFKKANGTKRHLKTSHVVHQKDARQWEGAHYTDGRRAWAFLKAVSLALGGRP